MNAESYALEARKLCGSLDANRWALAELAAQGKDSDIDNWAQIMGVEVGRSDKTIYGWVLILVFQKTIDPARTLRFGHYGILHRASDRLSPDKVLDLRCHAFEHNLSAESLREMVQDELQGDDVDPIREARHKLTGVIMKLSSIGRIAGLPMVFYSAIHAAQEALQMIKNIDREIV